MSMAKDMTTITAETICFWLAENIVDINVGVTQRVETTIDNWKVKAYRVGELIRVDIIPIKEGAW